MDEENARGVKIRNPMDATDRQCVLFIFIAMYAYIYLKQLESHIQESPRSPLQVVPMRTNSSTSWCLYGIRIWSPLQYALGIFSVCVRSVTLNTF
jgi:hypothetical protein